MYALRNRLLAVAAALTLGALLAPRPADASIPVAVSHPQFTQSAAPTLPASYVLLYVAPDGSFQVQFCRNDPVNQRDPMGLAAWSDMVWGAMETAQNFYGSRANNAFSQAGVAALMTITTPLAGLLSAADLATDQAGTFVGEVSARDFNSTHIPIVGPVAGSIGATTAAAVEDPSLVNVSRAVGANLGGVELAFGGVMIKRGIQGASREVQDAAPVRRGAANPPALLNPSIKVTEKGLQHVVERHTVNDLAKFAGKSKFNPGEDLTSLIQRGTQQPMVKQGSRFVRTFDAGKNIGLDRTAGQQTSIMTVVTEFDGALVTAFPGAP